jgi:glycosyltransferase involved in cell wall biosynthesis
MDMRPVRKPISGVARHAIDLAFGLDARNEFDLHGLYRGNPDNNPALQSVTGLHAKLPPVSDAHPKLMNAVLEFATPLSPFIIKEKFDIIHETFFGNAGAKRGAKKVATIHDVIPLEFPEYFNRSNVFFTKRNFYRQCAECDHIFSDSHYTKTKVLEYAHVDERRISVVPVGFTSKIPTPDAAYLTEKGLDGKRFLLFVGNMEPRKNIGAIARAMTKLGPAFDDVHVVVAGHLNFKVAPIIEESKSQLGDRFHVLGFVTEAQKWALLQAATAFVFPTFYEGFGIPVVECYRARCPILMANNSSLPELAVDDRQMFDAHSVDELAARIEDLLGNPPWVAAAVEKGAGTLGQYEYKAIAELTARTYNQILGT